MWKFIVKFGAIILINLFAFLLVWNILDALFETEGVFLIAGLVLSVLSLVLIWSIYVKKTLKEFNKIEEVKDKEKNK